MKFKSFAHFSLQNWDRTRVPSGTCLLVDFLEGRSDDECHYRQCADCLKDIDCRWVTPKNWSKVNKLDREGTPESFSTLQKFKHQEDNSHLHWVPMYSQPQQTGEFASYSLNKIYNMKDALCKQIILSTFVKICLLAQTSAHAYQYWYRSCLHLIDCFFVYVW